ncbi:MAG TPA: ATP-binding cassette domain-containing protein [Clostridiaceae bacterium]|nr:ATP-binding cassette domain-containing protein [Clostridiaceae bacterium]
MLEVKNLSKAFGNVIAVNNISFFVGKGKVFGLVGENGAGKTTTIRLLATMLKPTSGTAVLGGHDLVREPEKVRGIVGILFGGESGLYDRLTAAENIAYFGELNNMDKHTLKERIKQLTKIFEMEEYINRKTGSLSKGMKQKVAFARSIVHNPEIMLFDEPTSGLDVTAIRNVHEFIENCKNEGKTIIFSSHSMVEIEKLCDKIGIIHKGKLVDVGTVSELLEKHNENTLENVFVKLVGDKNES